MERWALMIFIATSLSINSTEFQGGSKIEGIGNVDDNMDESANENDGPGHFAKSMDSNADMDKWSARRNGLTKQMQRNIWREIRREIKDMKKNILPGSARNISWMEPDLRDMNHNFFSMVGDVRFIKNEVLYIKQQAHVIWENVTDTRRDHKRMNKTLWWILMNVTLVIDDIGRTARQITQMQDSLNNRVGPRLDEVIKKIVTMTGFEDSLRQMNSEFGAIKSNMNNGITRVTEEINIVREIVGHLGQTIVDIKEYVLAGFTQVDHDVAASQGQILSNVTDVGSKLNNHGHQLAKMTDSLVDIAASLFTFSEQIISIWNLVVSLTDRFNEFSTNFLDSGNRIDQINDGIRSLGGRVVDIHRRVSSMDTQLSSAGTQLVTLASNVNHHFDTVNVNLGSVHERILSNVSVVRGDLNEMKNQLRDIRQAIADKCVGNSIPPGTICTWQGHFTTGGQGETAIKPTTSLPSVDASSPPNGSEVPVNPAIPLPDVHPLIPETDMHHGIPETGVHPGIPQPEVHPPNGNPTSSTPSYQQPPSWGPGSGYPYTTMYPPTPMPGYPIYSTMVYPPFYPHPPMAGYPPVYSPSVYPQPPPGYPSIPMPYTPPIPPNPGYPPVPNIPSNHHSSENGPPFPLRLPLGPAGPGLPIGCNGQFTHHCTCLCPCVCGYSTVQRNAVVISSMKNGQFGNHGDKNSPYNSQKECYCLCSCPCPTNPSPILSPIQGMPESGWSGQPSENLHTTMMDKLVSEVTQMRQDMTELERIIKFEHANTKNIIMDGNVKNFNLLTNKVEGFFKNSIELHLEALERIRQMETQLFQLTDQAIHLIEIIAATIINLHAEFNGIMGFNQGVGDRLPSYLADVTRPPSQTVGNQPPNFTPPGYRPSYVPSRPYGRPSGRPQLLPTNRPPYQPSLFSTNRPPFQMASFSTNRPPFQMPQFSTNRPPFQMPQFPTKRPPFQMPQFPTNRPPFQMPQFSTNRPPFQMPQFSTKRPPFQMPSFSTNRPPFQMPQFSTNRPPYKIPPFPINRPPYQPPLSASNSPSNQWSMYSTTPPSYQWAPHPPKSAWNQLSPNSIEISSTPSTNGTTLSPLKQLIGKLPRPKKSDALDGKSELSDDLMPAKIKEDKWLIGNEKTDATPTTTTTSTTTLKVAERIFPVDDNGKGNLIDERKSAGMEENKSPKKSLTKNEQEKQHPSQLVAERKFTDDEESVQESFPYNVDVVPDGMMDVPNTEIALRGQDLNMVEAPMNPFVINNLIQRHINHQLMNAFKPISAYSSKKKHFPFDRWHGRLWDRYKLPLRPIFSMLPGFPLIPPPIQLRPPIHPIVLPNPLIPEPPRLPNIFDQLPPDLMTAGINNSPYSISYNDGNGNSWNVNVNRRHFSGMKGDHWNRSDEEEEEQNELEIKEEKDGEGEEYEEVDEEVEEVDDNDEDEDEKSEYKDNEDLSKEMVNMTENP